MTKNRGAKARTRQAAKASGTSYTTALRAEAGRQRESGWLADLIRKSVAAGMTDLFMEVSADQTRVRISAAWSEGGEMKVKVGEELTGAPAALAIAQLTSDANISFDSPVLDSSFRLDLDGQPSTVRCAVLRRFESGSTITLRLPNPRAPRTLDDLGMAKSNVAQVRAALDANRGLILFAGPAAAGKTTSAYAALEHLVAHGDRPFTVESPIERVIPGTDQWGCDGDEQRAKALYYALRVAADTMMLDEVRESETGRYAVRGALAGRRILTTIHAHDSITALLHLIELGGRRDALDVTQLVVAQRRIPALNHGWDGLDPAREFNGLAHLFEVLVVDDALRAAFDAGATPGELRAAANIWSFDQDAQRLIDAGVIDEESARRVL